jgi:hypothetical protein
VLGSTNGLGARALLFRRLEELRGSDVERPRQLVLHFETDPALAGFVVSNHTLGRAGQQRQIVLGQAAKLPPLAQIVTAGRVMRICMQVYPIGKPPRRRPE